MTDATNGPTYRGSDGKVQLVADMPTNYLRNALSSMRRFAQDARRWPDESEYTITLAALSAELERREADIAAEAAKEQAADGSA
jgi:hypothetical protein